MTVFWKTLKKSFADSYTHLALTILSSSVSTGIALIFLTLLRMTPFGKFPPILAAGVVVLYIFLLSPIIAGACAVSRKIILRDDPAPRDLFVLAREFMAPAWKLGLLQTIISLILLINVWFYFTHGGMALKIIAAIFLYMTLFWAMSSIYHFPVMIEQRAGVFMVAKRGILLAMDNLGFTVILFFAIILFACICAATFAGMALLYLGVFSMLATRMMRVLFVKYGLLAPEVEPEITDDRFPSIPRS